MSSFFSSDGSFSLQFAIIFAVIFLVLAAIVLTFRRFTGKGMALSAKAGSRGRQPRLGIVDIYELDRQRQLILLRRDNVEHLLLVGGPNDVVIERNINRSIGARLPAEDTDDEPAPEAAAVAYAAKPPQAAPYLEPTFEMPVVVQTPPPDLDPPVRQVVRPLDETVVTKRYDAAPDLTVVAPAPRRAQAQPASAIRRSPPSLVNLVPGSASMRSPASEERPSPVGPIPSSPVLAPTASRVIDAAILSDMARQLEEALRRPATAVRPAVPAFSEPETVPDLVEPTDEAFAPEPATLIPDAADVRMDESEPTSSDEVPPPTEPPTDPHAVDPIAAAMASAAPLSDDLFDEQDGQAEPASHVDAAGAEVIHSDAVAHEPEPVEAEPVTPVFTAPHPEPEAEAEPEPPLPPVAEPEPSAPPAPPQKPASTTPNPFSVEEIEAEFARLLGRPLDRKN